VVRRILFLFLAIGIVSLVWPFALSVESYIRRRKDIEVAGGSMRVYFPWMPRHTNNMLLVSRFNTLHGPASPSLSVAYFYSSPTSRSLKTGDDPSNFIWAREMELKYRASGYADVRYRTVVEGSKNIFCLQGLISGVQSNFCEDSTGSIRAIFTGSASSAEEIFAMLGTYQPTDGR
jgi:hypothetical protein